MQCHSIVKHSKPPDSPRRRSIKWPVIHWLAIEDTRVEQIMPCSEDLAQRPRRCGKLLVHILRVNLVSKRTGDEMRSELYGVTDHVFHRV